VLTAGKISVTLAPNANVCNAYPRVASAALKVGLEFMDHRFVQGTMHKRGYPATLTGARTRPARPLPKTLS